MGEAAARGTRRTPQVTPCPRASSASPHPSTYQLEQRLERDAEVDGMEAQAEGAGSKDVPTLAGGEGEGEAGDQAGKAPAGAGHVHLSPADVAQMRCG